MPDRNDEKKEQINENLSLIAKTTGLSFGTDAYLLSAYVRPKKRGNAIDLGAGTGVIALLCVAREKFAHVSCAEIQPAFCDIIRRNAEENRLSDRITVVEGDIREMTVREFGGEVDCVFSNPPYMRENSGMGNRHTENDTARHERNGTIADFCLAAARLLKHGGTFCVVFRPDRCAELLCAMQNAQLTPKRLTYVHATKDHPPSLVLCEGKKGAAQGMYVTKPLILSDERGEDSADLIAIYENGTFPERYFNP